MNRVLGLLLCSALLTPALAFAQTAPDQTAPAPATDVEEEGAPDENPDMLEDDAFLVDDEPTPAAPAEESAPPGEQTAPPPPDDGAAGPGEADPDTPPAADTELAAIPPEDEDAGSWSIVSSTTLGLSGAMGATVVTALVALLANPVVAAYVGINFFAPRAEVPVAGGVIALPINLLVAALYAGLFAGPLSGAAAVLATGLGATGLLLDDKGWAAAALYVAGGAAGGALAAVSGALVLAAVGMLLQVQHLDMPRVLDGQTEVVYLEPTPAIWAGALLLVGGLAGIAAPILSASVGNAVAQFAPAPGAAPGAE